jgi:hypothetical protein
MIMKKIVLSAILFFTSAAAFSQVLPSFQFGIKGGANLSKFSTGNLLSSENTAGYYAGFYARIGAAGINLQPELYLAGKNASLKDNATNEKGDVRFTSLDVPILVGTKIGAAGVGFRLNTGPVVSFILDKKQSFGNAVGEVSKGQFKDQAFAWQFGAGLDVASLGIDLRYEQGLTKLGQDGYQANRLSLFTIGLAYRLF